MAGWRCHISLIWASLIWTLDTWRTGAGMMPIQYHQTGNGKSIHASHWTVRMTVSGPQTHSPGPSLECIGDDCSSESVQTRTPPSFDHSVGSSRFGCCVRRRWNNFPHSAHRFQPFRSNFSLERDRILKRSG